jgi:3-hydroxyisobutyrate dehydrogenase-like beta-hydroxyacid dehydrogenase
MSDKPKIGWIGLGKMGVPMARNLIAAGYEVGAFNRTADKVKQVEGATPAATVAELAAASDIVISMIADDAALREVALGPAGVLANAKSGAVFVDMSTVSPGASAEIAAAAEATGVGYIRAPVSGSTVAAENKMLTVLASGPEEAFKKCEAPLKAFSKEIFYLGPGEQARYLKLAVNAMVGLSAAMIAEAMVFGEKGGIDRDQFLDALNSSVMASQFFDLKFPALRARDYPPAFSARQMAKDFDLILGAAQAADVPMPLSAQTRQIWAAMKASGRGDMDFMGCAEILEEWAGLDRET